MSIPQQGPNKPSNNCAVVWVGQRIQLSETPSKSWAYTFPILSCHMNVENTYTRSFAYAGKASMPKKKSMRKMRCPTKATIGRTTNHDVKQLCVVIGVGVRAEVRLCLFVSLIACICQSRMLQLPRNAIILHQYYTRDYGSTASGGIAVGKLYANYTLIRPDV